MKIVTLNLIQGPWAKRTDGFSWMLNQVQHDGVVSSITPP